MKSPSPYDGVLLIDKASGMTSHDVVAIVRNRLATQKVGHCGTLDPFATGLLLIVVGRGTKIQDLLMSEDKEYVGTMKLGEVTNTQDRDGEIIETRDGRSARSDQRSRVRSRSFTATFTKFRRWCPRLRRRVCRFTNSRVKERSLSGNLGAFMCMRTKFGKFVYRRSISESSAARVSMFAPTRTILVRNWDAELIFLRYAERSPGDLPWTVH